MVQQTGETRDAIIGDVEKRVEAIVNANSHRKDPYWIVIFAKPSRNHVNGKPVMMQHIKAYAERPQSQVGMIIGKVCNSGNSKIEWEVNMPQIPFDFDALQAYGAAPCNEVIVETTTIPHAYITK